MTGFWPGDPNEFGLLSYHTRGHLLGRPPHFGDKDKKEALHSQGILAGYSWLLAQATYQGTIYGVAILVYIKISHYFTNMSIIQFDSL